MEAALGAAAADGLWPGGARILVAASGGPDSTALLHALATLGPGLGVASVVAAHVDHGLRPGSAEDAEAVAALAARLGVGFRLARVEVEGPGGVQAAARRARYRALERLRLEVGADRVATGHSATDQAETVLLRLGRGTTPAGLDGHPPAPRAGDPPAAGLPPGGARRLVCGPRPPGAPRSLKRPGRLPPGPGAPAPPPGPGPGAEPTGGGGPGAAGVPRRRGVGAPGRPGGAGVAPGRRARPGSRGARSLRRSSPRPRRR